MDCPSGYRPEVWEALPLDVQIELISNSNVTPRASCSKKAVVPPINLQHAIDAVTSFAFGGSKFRSSYSFPSLAIRDELHRHTAVSKRAMEQIEENFDSTNGKKFLDSDFAPEPSSIDGNTMPKAPPDQPGETLQEPMCRCKRKAKLCTVSKQNKNMGRRFWGCYTRDCSFFAWARVYSHSKQALAIRWARPMPPPFYPKLARTVNGEVQFKACDIRQGKLGNCWFLAALSTVAEIPELIHNIILTKEKSQSGAYHFRFFVNGLWRLVSVDDALPRLPKKTKPSEPSSSTTAPNDVVCLPLHDAPLAYSGATHNQLWVPLVEKAYAKVHGSYKALSGGWVAEALFDLTSFPTESLLLDFDQISTSQESLDLTWVRLSQFCSEGYPMGASCVRPTPQCGLVGGHAYSILEIKEVLGAKIGVQRHLSSTILGIDQRPKRQKLSSEPLRMVRLRNPWGKKRSEWKGAFASSSDEWTPELRQVLQPEKGEDTFWMSYNDFVREFYQVDVCKATLDWFSHSFHSQVLPNSEFPEHAMRIHIPKTTKGSLSLIQPPKRGKSLGRYFYEAFAICVVRFTTSRDQAQESHRFTNVTLFALNGQCKCVHHDLLFEPGDYLVVPVSLGRTQFTSQSPSRAPTGLPSAPFTVRLLTAKPGTTSNILATRSLCSKVFKYCLLARISREVAMKHVGLSNLNQYGAMKTNTVVQVPETGLLADGTCLVLVNSRAAALAIAVNTHPLCDLEVSFLLHGPGEGATNVRRGEELPRFRFEKMSVRLVACVASIPLQDYEIGLSDSLDVGTGIYGSFALDRVQMLSFVPLDGQRPSQPDALDSPISLGTTWRLETNQSSSSSGAILNLVEGPHTASPARQKLEIINSTTASEHRESSAPIDLVSDDEGVDVVVVEQTGIVCMACRKSFHQFQIPPAIPECGHLVCAKCVRSHVLPQVEQCRKVLETITCPVAHCDAKPFVGSYLKQVMDKGTRNRLEYLSLERMVERQPSLYMCPSPGCNYVVAWNGLDDGEPKLQCPKCLQSSCLVCKSRPFHEGRACNLKSELQG